MAGGKVVGLILAGGRSSRMGAVKPLQNLDGKTAIRWAVDTFKEAGIEDVRVVTGFHGATLQPVLAASGTATIVNPSPERGMLSSVQAGLREICSEADAFLMLPADIPMVRSRTVNRLLERHRAQPASVIYPVFFGVRGHPPLIPKRCFKAILEAGPENNLRQVLEDFEDTAEEVQCADAGILMDMDTPEDYRAMLRHCETRGIPTGGECAVLFRLYRTPDRVIRHCEAVAAVASEIAGRLNRKAHLALNVPQIYAAALLHDIAREMPCHGRAGADIVTVEGFPDLAESIAVHMDLALPDGAFEIGCREILYLADKLVDEDQLVPLELRLARALERKAAAVPEKAALRLQTAQRIKGRIEALLGIGDLYAALYPWAQ